MNVSIIILMALTLIAAYLFRLLHSNFTAGDTRGVFWRLERLKGRRWVHYELDDCALPGHHGYPVLFQWLISRLPREKWIRGGYLINSSIDLLVGIALFACLSLTTQWRAMFDPSTQAVLPFLVTTLFLFSPALLPTNARQMAFNGRAFGFLLLCVYATLLYLFVQEQALWAYLCAGLVTVIIVLSSQFAFQALVPLTIGVSIAYGSWAVPAVPVASLAIASIFRKLGVREPLRYFMGLYEWQFAQRKANTMPSIRAHWFRSAWLQFRARQYSYLWVTLLDGSPQFATLLFGPSVVVVAYFFIFHSSLSFELWSDPISRFAIVVTASMTATTVVTWFSPFSIFGQAERYLEYAAPFSSFLAVMLFFQSAASVAQATLAYAILLTVSLGLCFLNLIFSSLRFGLLFGGKNTYLTKQEYSFLPWFGMLPDQARVLTVPLTRGKTVSVAQRSAPTDANSIRVLYDWLTLDGERPLTYMSRLMVGYQFNPQTCHAFLDEHDFDALLIYKKEAVVIVDTVVSLEWKLLVDELAEDWDVVGEDETYCLVARRERIRHTQDSHPEIETATREPIPAT